MGLLSRQFFRSYGRWCWLKVVSNKSCFSRSPYCRTLVARFSLLFIPFRLGFYSFTYQQDKAFCPTLLGNHNLLLQRKCHWIVTCPVSATLLASLNEQGSSLGSQERTDMLQGVVRSKGDWIFHCVVASQFFMEFDWICRVGLDSWLRRCYGTGTTATRK